MKITKIVHSCLLVESDGRTGLFDPGNYAWDSGFFDIHKINKIDDIIITHEHQDHMSLPFIKAVLNKFPSVNIITTNSASQQLNQQGINNVTTLGNEFIEIFPANHESVVPLFSGPIENIGVHYLNKISHPGDSHHFDQTKEVLALPMTAPWGSMIAAVQLGLKLSPKHIIPIHDWHYKDEAKAGLYDRLVDIFNQHGITFHNLADGQQIEIDS